MKKKMWLIIAPICMLHILVAVIIFVVGAQGTVLCVNRGKVIYVALRSPSTKEQHLRCRCCFFISAAGGIFCIKIPLL